MGTTAQVDLSGGNGKKKKKKKKKKKIDAPMVPKTWCPGSGTENSQRMETWDTSTLLQTGLELLDCTHCSTPRSARVDASRISGKGAAARLYRGAGVQRKMHAAQDGFPH